MARLVLFGLLLLQFGLAAIRDFEQAKIFFDGTQVRFQTSIMRSDAAVFVPLRELAQSMGLEQTYDTRQDSFTIRRPADNRTIILRTGSRRITVNNKADELNHPPLRLKNNFYVPLNDFLWTFGYFVERDNQDNYYIVTRLNTVTWDKQTLTLQGDAPLRVQLTAVPEGYQLLLRHTILGAAHTNRISPADGIIDSIEYAQASLNPGIVRILIRAKTPPAYTVTQKDAVNSYVIQFNYQPRPELLKPETAERPEQVVSAVSSTGFPGINALWLPENFLSSRKNIDIIIRGNTVNAELKSRTDTLFVDFDSVFGQLGCTLTKENGAYILTDNRGRIYRLENGMVYGPDFQEKYTLLREGGKDYFPLVQTLKIIGFAAYYTRERIYINPRIYELSYADRNNQRRVVIRANDKLLPGNLQYLDNPPRALIDIPQSSYDVSINILRINDRNVKNVRAAQFDKGIVRVVVDLPDLKNKPVLSFEEDGRALVLLFDTPKLTRIAVAADKDNNLNLKFLADTVLLNNYTVQRLENPSRLVLDFPGVALDLASETQVRQGPVERVRSSQLSWEPLTARVVLDLNNSYRQHTRETDGSLNLLQRASTATFNPVTEIQTGTAPTRAPVTAARPTADVLRGLRVAIIVGHGGNDPGAISRSGHMEKNLTLELAKKLQTLLRERGAIAMLSREGDENISLVQQAEFAIRNKADVLISIHLNNFVNETTNGAESFFYKPIDYEFARRVHNEIIKQTGLTDRGLRKAQMHNLNHTTMPGVLIEPLFLSNRKEEALIITQDFQWKLMRAVVTGIENYQLQK